MVNKYISHYKSIERIYPSVHALRLFLGRYPDFSFREMDLKGKKILDIGFGDGRDLILFNDLGMDVYGCEPEEEVVKHRTEFFQAAGIHTTLKAGTNMSIPFEDDFFDILYSSAAIYYMPSLDHSIHDALVEARRVLKKGAYMASSFLTPRAHYIDTAEKLTANLYRLSDPFFKQREGQIVYAHNSEDELRADLERAGFTNMRFGLYDANWFGITESLILVTCQA